MSRRAELRSAVEARAVDDEIDAFAARDDELPLAASGCPYLPADPSPARWGRSMSSLADDVLALGRAPMWSWGFPTLDREAPIPVGSLVYIVGATGRGKSSLLAQIATTHARTAGPALVVSAELAGAIFAARIVAQGTTGATWIDVVRGGVAHDVIASALDVPGLAVVDEVASDWPARLTEEIASMKAEWADRTPLVVVDYVQLLQAEGKDPRERTTAASRILRDTARRTGAVIVAIAKSNRAAGRAIRSGEMAGVDATEAGAEASALEYDAIAQVVLGAMKPIDEDDPRGPQIVDVSIAKTRFGVADLVIPFRFDGARGVFSEHGDAVPASQRKADAAEARKRDRATSKAADTAIAIAGRRALALTLARNAGSVSLAGYVGMVKGRGEKCSESTAGTDLGWLESAGLLAWSHDKQRGRLLTDAGQALLQDADPAARLAELARTKVGAP